MRVLYAALIFFTRLPFWRLYNPPKEAFREIVNYWWFAGIVTGGIMAGGFYAASLILPTSTAAIVAVALRLLATGALHEDGLADFFDGFGGGSSRERILAIMKDSFIGSYGTIGLIIYFLLLVCSITALPQEIAPAILFFGDIFNKALSGYIIQLLPYARKEEESKAKNVYVKMSPAHILLNFAVMALCLAALHLLCGEFGMLPLAALAPALLFLLLILFLKRRLGGYTGDCCGALFLLCELSLYITITAMTR